MTYGWLSHLPEEVAACGGQLLICAAFVANNCFPRSGGRASSWGPPYPAYRPDIQEPKQKTQSTRRNLHTCKASHARAKAGRFP